MGPPDPTLLSEQFGPLQGVRVLSTGTIVAEPVAAMVWRQRWALR